MKPCSKTCNTCGLEKSLDSFTKTGGSGPHRDRPRGQCRLCRSKATLTWKLSNKYRYNLTQEQYDAMLQEQSNRCLICKRVFDTNPCIDHDHACCPGKDSCGKCIRGLLCTDCNRLLGCAKDTVSVLRAAVRYLLRSNK